MASSSAAGFVFLLLSIYSINHAYYAQGPLATAPAEACKPISQVKGWSYCLESVRHGANVSNEPNCCSIAKKALMAEAKCSCDQRYSGFVDFVSVRKLFAACNVSATTCISDTIDATQSFEVGNFLVSEKGNFVLEFLSSGLSIYDYLAIRYGNIDVDNVVWVANRDRPLGVSTGVLRLSPKGNLTLLDGTTNRTHWFSDSSKSSINPVAQLLDTGNLVIRHKNDRNSSNYLWQSFDRMGDTLIPGMKWGINLANGQENYLTSWGNEDDPSIKVYTSRIDTTGVPQIFLKKYGSLGASEFRAGPWDGLQFSGFSTDIFEFVINKREIFYRLKQTNNSVITRIRLAPNGTMQSLYWVWMDDYAAEKWEVSFTMWTSNCDRYSFCGGNGFCSREKCDCLRGFVPNGINCVRRTPLECRDSDGFLKYTGVKLPDTRRSWYNKTINLKDCRDLCLRNCSCTAYANLDIRDGGSGCIHWFHDLMDIRQYNLTGRDLYIKLAASEIGEAAHGSSKWMIRLLELIIPLFVGFVTLGLIGRLLILRRIRKLKNKDKREEEIDLPLFDFKVIDTATNNFSNDSKLGKGGFGSVYKGVLIDGEHIAVKRLSKNSRQGLKEFKNEVVLIAKLQHRNLVKLLGCCIEGDERMLIYEYMPNNSLDSFIFDQTRSKLLDWHKRLQIIVGIARGMLYLHEDSRLRIIHRDLKASNVLLDNYMNPKISDFGMARMLGGDETADKTRKVVGTYGYMSPEYLVDGRFSIKSDVFSFGVLVLEIVSGRRNRGFSNPNHEQNLIGHAWILWLEDRSLELIDDAVGDSYVFAEVLRYIQVGLLCVQKQAKDRPDMSSAVLMLTSEGSLPQPKQPGFFIEKNLPNSKSSSSKPNSINEVTISLMDPR